MKKELSFLFLALGLLAEKSKAQIVTGNTFHIKSGTTVFLDSLVLIPATDLQLGNNTLNVTQNAIPGSPTSSIKKVFVFNNNFVFNGTAGVYYSPSQLSGNTESLLEIAYSPASASEFVVSSGSTQDPANHYVNNSISNIDIRMLTLVNGQSALPVTLVAFDAEKAERAVKLTWKTSFETNSDFFEIQRSPDAKEWQPLGRVTSAGESKGQVSYDFTDGNPFSGDNYYRLKMTDQDGTFAFSQIRKVSWAAGGLTVFPNPAVDRLEVDVKDWSKVAKVRILNAAGRIVREGGVALNSKQNNVPLTGFKPGNYILQIEYRDGSSERTHFVKY